MRSAVLRWLNIFLFFFHSGEFLYLSWSFSQSHPFAFSPFPSHHRSSIGRRDVGVLGVLDFFLFFFCGTSAAPHMCCSASWACSVYTSSFPAHEPKSRCAARCELRCLSREKKLNLWGRTEDRRASVRRPDDVIWPVALACYILQPTSINKYKVLTSSQGADPAAATAISVFSSRQGCVDFHRYIPLIYHSAKKNKTPSESKWLMPVSDWLMLLLHQIVNRDGLQLIPVAVFRFKQM